MKQQALNDEKTDAHYLSSTVVLKKISVNFGVAIPHSGGAPFRLPITRLFCLKYGSPPDPVDPAKNVSPDATGTLLFLTLTRSPPDSSAGTRKAN
jgi:hypothetical protein